MKCPICGKDLELKNKQIGTNENGEPIFNEYAICRDCRKQWNLDKQRAKKMAAKKAAAASDSAKTSDRPKISGSTKSSDNVKTSGSAKTPDSGKTPGSAKTSDTAKASDSTKKMTPPREKKSADTDNTAKTAGNSSASKNEDAAKKAASAGKTGSAKKPVSKKSASGKTVASSQSSEVKAKRRSSGDAEASAPAKKPVKKRSVQESGSDGQEKRYSNIPSEKVRTKHEKAARKGYEDMLATGTIPKPDKKKKQVKDDTKALRSAAAEKPDTKAAKNDDYDDYDDDYYEDAPRFRVMRVILAILSLAGFGYFIYRGFTTGLTSDSGSGLSAGMVYVILALCLLVSALLYFIMLGTNTVFAFLLPMVFYLGSGVFAFLNRGDDMQMLIAAVAAAVLAVISLILAITSRGGDDYDDDDYDDAFEDDYADDYDD